MICVGAGVVVVTGKVGDEEIGILRLIVGLRVKRRTDGRDAGVGDRAGGEAGAGVGVVGFQNVLRDAVPAAVVGRDPVPEVVVVGVALDVAGGVALQFGVGRTLGQTVAEHLRHIIVLIVAGLLLHEGRQSDHLGEGHPLLFHLGIHLIGDLLVEVRIERLNVMMDGVILQEIVGIREKITLALEEAVREKKEKTQRQIKNYAVVPYKNEMLQMMEDTIRKYGHKEHYCCIVRDSNGRVCVIENEILEIADRRAWEVTNMIYNNDFSMYRALKAGVNVTKATDSNNPEIQRIFREWNMDNRFDRKARMYCDLHENTPLLLEECNFIERKYKDYYDALGREGFESSYWREDYIKQALAPVPMKLLPRNEIAGRLMNVLKVGGEYTRSEVKEILRGIYHDLGIQGKPSASDITGYLICEEKTIRTKRTVKAMFRIISHAREKVSLFSRITDVNQPKEYDVDKLLEIIRDGTYYHLKLKVEAVRSAGTKDEKNRKKALLPVVTWNGTFKSRHKNECTVYSSYTALDFDHIEPKDMPAFVRWLQGFPCVYACFVTPGGTGYKAIILHDNCEPLYHYDLYGQLVKLFDCPWIDKSTTDLARGNYLSYDPALWKNPNPIPFHFVPGTPEPVIPNTMTETVIRDVQGEPVLVRDESWVEGFLNQLSRQVISDDSIIRILRKAWNGKSLSNGRNNTAMSYAGILCKAGVEPDKAKAFIEELIPGFDITEIVGYAYTHNIFGCERMRYRSKK